jgi:deoxycytidine triphosphate deaminase
MILTAQQILEYGIVKPSPYSKPAQVGIDLSLRSVHRIETSSIVLQNTTMIDPAGFEELIPETNVEGLALWRLTPGAYAITFNEGCEFPDWVAGFIIHRSSLYRTGNSIVSPVWDPGYKTDIMGTVLIVSVGLVVEVNARVAQMVCHTTGEPAELYNGQFQGGTHSWEKAST